MSLSAASRSPTVSQAPPRTTAPGVLQPQSPEHTAGTLGTRRWDPDPGPVPSPDTESPNSASPGGLSCLPSVCWLLSLTAEILG